MEPRIGRSIGQGFLAASKSWAGIALFAAGLTGLTLLVVLGVLLTNPPPKAFERRAQAPRFELPGFPAQEAQAQEPPAPAANAGTGTETEADTGTEPATEEPAAEKPAAGGDEEVSLFDQLETAEDKAAVAPPALPAAPAPDAQATAQAQAEEARAVSAWFGRAWPVLLLLVLIAVAGNVWLSAGQIGYVAKRVTSQRAPISEFWRVGTRAFVPVLGGVLLGLAGLAALVVTVFLFSALLGVLPNAARAVLGVVFGAALLVGLVWLVVRLAFWFIIIVADRQGPLAALKASFRASRGRWWRLAGLGALLVLISYAVWLPFAFLEWIGGVVGGGAAVALGAVSNLGGLIASLYVGFAALGAYIRFYEDTKPVPAGASPMTARPITP